MNLIPRMVPWMNWDEWDNVRSLLWSEQTSEILKAMEIIKMWRLRGKLPHAIESTYQLMEIKLLSRMGSSEKLCMPQRSQMELRNLSCLAIIRTVNSLVDPSQQGVYAESIYNIANRIGLPGWIVEMRHDATHNGMPSLALLQHGCSELLDWLNEHYWTSQQKYITELSMLCLPTAAGEEIPFASHSNSFDASSTFLADINIPLMIENVIFSPRNKTDDLLVRCRLWDDEIANIAVSFPQFIHSLVFRIVVALMDNIENPATLESIQEVTNRGILWLRHLISEFPKTTSSSINIENLSSAVLYRLKKIELPPDISNEFLIIQELLSSRYPDTSDIEILKHNDTTEFIERDASFPMWPIGLMPGSCHTNFTSISHVEETS